MLSNITVNFKKIFGYIKYSGGEVQLKLDGLNEYLINDERFINANDEIVVTAHIKSPDDILMLCQLKDALDNLVDKNKKIILIMPYLPYARYDRRMHDSDSHSLKVFANIINSLNFYKVYIYDCHSDVGLSLINNISHLDQLSIFETSSFNDEFNDDNLQDRIDTVIAPDVGAIKKSEKIAEKLGVNLVICNKSRDLTNGKITGYDILKGSIGKNVLIVDDICDGGMTFILLSKSIKEKYPDTKIYLWVTHGIFSKGVDDLLKYIDGIYCDFSWTEDMRIKYNQLY